MNFRPSKHDRATFGKIASEYDLTYYGTMMADSTDGYVPVRGITASPEQVDDNYTTGTLANYPVQLLQRSHDIYLRDNRRVHRTWTICHTDLHVDLPHLIIGSRHKRSGDESTLASYLRMYEISLDSLGCPIADDFANKFAVYVSPQDIQVVQAIFTPEFQAMLSVHFADNDFEIDGRNLYAYATKQPLTLTDLDHQLRIIIWLAQYLDQLYRDR